MAPEKVLVTPLRIAFESRAGQPEPKSGAEMVVAFFPQHLRRGAFHEVPQAEHFP